MRKLIGIIVVLFIMIVMMSIFGFIKEFGILDNMGANIYASYGRIGSFFFYTIYAGLFIGVTSWAVKASWRNITNGKKTLQSDSKINQVHSEEKSNNKKQSITEIDKDKIACPHCETKNNKARKVCFKCKKELDNTKNTYSSNIEGFDNSYFTNLKKEL